MTLKKEVWIGLVHVKFRPSYRNFKKSGGAYTNVLAWAASAPEFRSQARRAVADYGDMIVRKIEDVEPLNRRLQSYALPKNILRLARDVWEKHSVQCDTFYAYSSKKRPVNRQISKRSGTRRVVK